MRKKISWGIVGSSSVTRQFCNQLIKIPEAEVRHVCSRRAEGAEQFAKQLGAASFSNDLQTLLKDDDIDVVYLSSPTRLHAEQAIACLEKGKAVLCEKPLAVSTEEVEKIIHCAKSNGVFCMEAMWMRFNPLVKALKSLIEEEALGDIVSVHAEIGYKKDRDRLSNPNRGAVWDFSVYGLSLFQFLLGNPDVIVGPQKKFVESGRTCSALLHWKSGIYGSLTASIDADLPNQFSITGTKGSLVLGPSFICPSALKSTMPIFKGSRVLAKLGRLAAVFSEKVNVPGPFQKIADPMSGFLQEALEVQHHLRSNQIESPTMPLRDSLAVIQLAEEIEKAGGNHG